LKKELLEALKNAANIRAVKSEESITIAVVGNRAVNATARVKRVTKTPGNAPRKADILYATDASRTGSRDTMLTIRVKKSDVDAFAKGTIEFDEFKKRAAVSAY
jgi:hypothetical protein